VPQIIDDHDADTDLMARPQQQARTPEPPADGVGSWEAPALKREFDVEAQLAAMTAERDKAVAEAATLRAELDDAAAALDLAKIAAPNGGRCLAYRVNVLAVRRDHACEQIEAGQRAFDGCAFPADTLPSRVTTACRELQAARAGLSLLQHYRDCTRAACEALDKTDETDLEPDDITEAVEELQRKAREANAGTNAACRVETLRDRFAVAAMQSLILKPDVETDEGNLLFTGFDFSEEDDKFSLAHLAYEVADALLRVRDGLPPQ